MQDSMVQLVLTPKNNAHNYIKNELSPIRQLQVVLLFLVLDSSKDHADGW
jgi:hypothetical protein